MSSTATGDTIDEDIPWCDLFIQHTSPYYGWVKDLETANSVVEEFSLATSTTYAVPRTTKSFGKFSLDGEAYSFVKKYPFPYFLLNAQFILVTRSIAVIYFVNDYWCYLFFYG